jgi:hypothetical protein
MHTEDNNEVKEKLVEYIEEMEDNYYYNVNEYMDYIYENLRGATSFTETDLFLIEFYLSHLTFMDTEEVMMASPEELATMWAQYVFKHQGDR